MRSGWICLAVGLSTVSAGRAQETDPADREAILAVVQQFFDTMTAADSAGAAATLLPEGVNWHVQEGLDGVAFGHYTTAEYLASLPGSTRRYVERMWDPTVLIRGPLAVVWTPYDIYADGEFLHCGVDTFTLLETEGGWKIAGIAYTREPTGCEPSPLGPLEDDAGG